MAHIAKGLAETEEKARFKYIKWDPKFVFEKPYVLMPKAPDDFPIANFTNEDGCVESVQDIRGNEQLFDLDQHGFAVRTYGESDSFDLSSVDSDYIPSIHKLLKKDFGPNTEVITSDWRVRNPGC